MSGSIASLNEKLQKSNPCELVRGCRGHAKRPARRGCRRSSRCRAPRADCRVRCLTTTATGMFSDGGSAHMQATVRLKYVAEREWAYAAT